MKLLTLIMAWTFTLVWFALTAYAVVFSGDRSVSFSLSSRY